MLKGTPIRFTNYMQMMHNMGFLTDKQAKTVIEE